MTFQVILCFALIFIIYFAKPDSSGLSSFVFKTDNRGSIRFRPVTKLILIMVVVFFANNLFLNKLINKESKESSIVNKIEQKQFSEEKQFDESKIGNNDEKKNKNVEGEK